jgi:peptide/nickel transport system substrate-binding protein
MNHTLYKMLAFVMLFSLALAACAPASSAAQATAVLPAEATATTAPAVEATATTGSEATATSASGAATAEATATPASESTPTTAAAAGSGNSMWSPQLKQAFAAAIDREAIVDRVFEGRNTPAYGMVPPSYPGSTEPFSDKYGTRNLDMAKKILTDLGYTADKPFTFDLYYPPDHYGTTTADVMQVIKQQLEETGLIKVNLQTQAWAQYIGESVPKGKFPAFILGWFPDFADAETWLTPFGSCNQSPDQGVFYCDPALDKLLAEQRSETDPAKRAVILKQIGDYWAENVPTLPLFWEPEYISVRKGVNNVSIASVFEFNYWTVSFDPTYKPASGKQDTLIIGTTDSLDSLDPADAYATHDWEIMRNTGVPLMTFTPGTNTLVPGAASAAPKVSDGGKTYTYTLRDNLKFADGTPVTSADYVRNFKRLTTLKGQVASLVTNYVDSVDAPDPKTVVYHLKDAYAFFPQLTATPPFIPGNPKDFPDGKLNAFPATLNGDGPYRMVSYKEGQQLVLEANPNYFGEQPKIKNVIIKYFDKPTTMSQAVEKGEIDVAWRILGAVEAVRLQSVAGVVVTKIDAPTLRYLVFNMKWPKP